MHIGQLKKESIEASLDRFWSTESLGMVEDNKENKSTSHDIEF